MKRKAPPNRRGLLGPKLGGGGYRDGSCEISRHARTVRRSFRLVADLRDAAERKAGNPSARYSRQVF